MGKLLDVKYRVWLYGVGVSLSSVGIVYGLITLQEATVWLALLAAILGVTAIANVGERGVEPRHAEETE